MIGIGAAFKHLTLLSGLGPFDKLLGFVFGASKFFFITAVIAHASYNIQALKSLIDDSSLKTSILFPILTETGSYIMKLDPVGISQDIDTTTQEFVTKSTQDIAEDTLKQLKDSMPNMEK